MIYKNINAMKVENIKRAELLCQEKELIEVLDGVFDGTTSMCDLQLARIKYREVNGAALKEHLKKALADRLEEIFKEVETL